MGVPTSLMIYEGEGHAIREGTHRDDLRQRTLDWLDKYLGNAASTSGS
jgi:dipeptidyl aminopeptidase/acylaminoacyl peptidase